MTLTVHPVNLDRDRDEVLDVLARTLPAASDSARFEWLYLQNPAGPAWSWFVRDRNGTSVGIGSLFPRLARLDDREIRCGVVGDFGIAASHRTLGPAMQLQKATFAPVDRGDLALCYDCVPHETGMATFRRMGMDVTRETHRYKRLVRVDGQVRRRLGENALGSAAAWVGNSLLRLRRGRGSGKPRSGLDIRIHEGGFDESFTALDKATQPPEGLRARRDAQTLNWRYRTDPLRGYRVLVAELRGELEGFLILRTDGSHATVMDLVARTPDVATTLVRAADEHSPSGTEVLQVDLPDTGTAFQDAGYVRREAGPSIVAYARNGTLPEGWHFLTCDLGF